MPKVTKEDGTVYTDHKAGNPFDCFEDTCANYQRKLVVTSFRQKRKYEEVEATAENKSQLLTLKLARHGKQVQQSKNGAILRYRHKHTAR